MDVARLGIAVDSSEAVDASGDLDRLTASGARAEQQSAKLGRSTKVASDAARRGRTDWRQIGLQFNQVSQQTAATGNFMQALSIQLPDILMFLGPIGLAAGIASPAIFGLGQSFFAAGEDARGLDETLGDLETAMSDIDRAGKIAGQSLDELQQKYGQQALAVRELYRELVAVNQQQALNATQAAIAAAENQLTGIEDRLRDFAAARREFLAAQDVTGALRGEIEPLEREMNEALRSLQDEFNLTSAQAYRIVGAMEDIREAKGPEEAAEASKALSSAIASAADEGANLDAVLINVANSAATAFAAFSEALELGRRVTDNMQSGVGLETDQFGGSTLLPPTLEEDEGRKRRRGGGGRSLADRFQSDLERLQQQLMTEREVVDEWYFESQEILADRRAQEILGEEEHKNALLALEEEYQNRVSGVRDSGNSHALSGTSKFFGDMANATAKGSGAMFEVTKKFSAAQGIINSYAAFTEVLKDPSFIGRPWARVAAAGAALSAGLGAVSSLRSVSPGGGGGSLPSSSIASSGLNSGASAASQQDGGLLDVRVQLAGVQPGDMIRVSDIPELYEAIVKESGRRGFRSITFV